MIHKLANALSSEEFSKVVKALESLPRPLDCFVGLSDINLAPLLASAVKPPLVYVSSSQESIAQIQATLECCGLKTLGISHAPEPPLFNEKDLGDPLFAPVQKFLSGGVDALVIYAPLLRQKIPVLNNTPLGLVVGQRIKISEVTQVLAQFGFERVGVLTGKNQFSVRGDVLDFWQGTSPTPIRVMFLGSQIEAIRTLDMATLTSRKSLDSITISPLQSEILSSDQIRTALDKINANLAGKTKHENTKKILSTITTKLEKQSSVGGARWLAPFIHTMRPVQEILSDTNPTFVYEKPREIEESLRDFEKQFALKLSSLIEGGLLLPEHSKSLGGQANFALDELARVGTHRVNFQTSSAGADLNFTTLPVPSFYSSFSALVPDMLRNVSTGKTVIVFAGTSPALANYLFDKKMPFEFATLDEIKSGKINLVRGTLNISFELAKERVVVYSVTQVSALPLASPIKKSQAVFAYPFVGEVVVHEFHGLGRFLGVQDLEIGEVRREFIALQYDGGAIVYVPIDQTHLLSNYIGEPARLNRIGGQDFTQVKQRVRRRLAQLSMQLAKLYSKRARATANKYSASNELVSEFVRSAPFKYTDDQQSALTDILADMSGNKVMDRLICGDVGVGKTEVALASAFKAVMSGFQVALLCPTTILSQQHFSTFTNRLGAFGARVEVLNRFKTDQEARAILEAVKSGDVDVLVGTHRILSPDVRFRNLSLLILDEEQRFGVSHKEKIKHLKTNIDVLTLSATPIPRTLNMALLGIRDISTINTPPADRMSVLTYVVEYSDELVREAIARELHRGGQVIILYNRVEKIDHFAGQVAKLLLDSGLNARIRVAHGQMREGELETVIRDLYARQIDVLVCSTIIENGIDIATANTLVALDSDRLGVAQMHQIRGRVGRSDRQAYAYFTYPRSKELSDTSRERLDAIRQHSQIGSGYNIAMRDLQLRGAGDILGENQSGHIGQVGFDLYARILADVAKDTRAEPSLSEDALY